MNNSDLGLSLLLSGLLFGLVLFGLIHMFIH